MKRNFITTIFVLSIAAFSCNDPEDVVKSPAGYNLAKPEKFFMPEVLLEISGIAFNQGNNDTLYAQQDEEGKLFYL